jgi:hypothetical protein
MRRFLSALPFVCISLLAADTGGAPAALPPRNLSTPTWAPPATEPVATGDTLEAKLTNAASHIKTFFTNLGLALAAFTKLEGDYKTLEGQFNSLKETARVREGRAR